VCGVVDYSGVCLVGCGRALSCESPDLGGDTCPQPSLAEELAMAARSPASPPTPALLPADRAEVRFDLAGRTVAAANGWCWIVSGWELFRRQAGMWILLVLLFVVVLLVPGAVPVVGGAAAALAAPVLAGGLMMACKTADEGGGVQVEQLFAGFRRNTQPLVMVGVFHLVASLLIILLLTIFVGANVGIGALLGGTIGYPGIGAMTAGIASLLLAAVIGVALAVPVYAAICCFAPALIVFHDVEATAALKASFFAILENIPSTLWYSLILLGLAIVAGIPFGLGYLVLAPVTVASIYASYRDIFFVP
jgi:uncharacterized membrane protein